MKKKARRRRKTVALGALKRTSLMHLKSCLCNAEYRGLCTFSSFILYIPKILIIKADVFYNCDRKFLLRHLIFDIDNRLFY
jgi:hypothetical protein